MLRIRNIVKARVKAIRQKNSIQQNKERSAEPMCKKIICVVIVILMAFGMVACGNQSISPPTAPPSPDNSYAFTGRAVNWAGRVTSVNPTSTPSAQLQRNGTANLAHIRVLSGRHVEVPISFTLPSEITQVRILGDVFRMGPVNIQTVINNAPRLQGNSHTLTFSSNSSQQSSGTIVLWAEGRSSGITQSGFFSVTYERVQSLAPDNGHVIRPGPPTGGRPPNATQINSIPSNLQRIYTASHSWGEGSVDVGANRITATNALLNMRIGYSSGGGIAIPTPHHRFGIWGDLILGRIYYANGEVYVMATYRSGSNTVTMDININSEGLLISNANSISGNSRSNPGIIYRCAATENNPGNWVQINWVTVSAFAAEGSVIGDGTFAQDALVELHAVAPFGEEFEGWFIDDTLISENSVLVFNAIADMEIEARFSQESPEPATITSTALPNGTVGTWYNQRLEVTGTTPIAVTHTEALPPGLILSPDGVLSGTPTQPGTFNFTVSATNSAGSDSRAFTIIVEKSIVNQLITIANGASAWARPYVNEAYIQNLTPPNLLSNFTQAITRAEFTAIVVRLYEEATGREITGRTNFVDTNDVNVRKMGYLGVILGIGEGRFDPNGQLTREQAATILSRLATVIGLNVPENNVTFADAANISDWAIVAVGQMQATGIMGGVGNNMFSPQGSYTREQSIVTIMRLFEFFEQ